MRRTAEHFARKYGVKFYYEDFRPGWQEGIDISLELGLYRQPYCGCVFSEEERYTKSVSNREKKRRMKEKLQMAEAAEQKLLAARL